MNPESILDALASVPLRLGERHAQILGTPPDWLLALFPNAAAAGQIDFADLPAIESFASEAHAHWESGQTTPLLGSPWILVDPATGSDVALEPTAIRVDGQPIVVVCNMGDRFAQMRRVQQAARNAFLTREDLEREVSRRTQDIRDREEELLHRLLSAATQHDNETGTHNRRIGLYAAEFATLLGWSPIAIDEIRLAAPMHDVGKIGIPDAVLRKPGRLDAEEREIIEQHPEIGGRILGGSEISTLAMASEIALGHHERWDGSGYPRGQRAKEIPETARLVAIVDFYDALSSARVYKDAMPESEVIEELRAGAGSHFDPELVELFLVHLDRFRAIREAHPD